MRRSEEGCVTKPATVLKTMGNPQCYKTCTKCDSVLHRSTASSLPALGVIRLGIEALVRLLAAMKTFTYVHYGTALFSGFAHAPDPSA